MRLSDGYGSTSILMNINPFIRGSLKDVQEFKPGIVLLVGNGAIKGDTWKPVNDTKAEFARGVFTVETSKGIFKEVRERSDPYIKFINEEFFLANLGYVTKTYRARLGDPGLKPELREELEKGLKGFLEGRKDLERRYHEQQASFSLKELPVEVIKYLNELKNKKIGIITTNWDSTIESIETKYPFSTQILYVHGICSEAGSIVLPVEMVLDIDKTTHVGNALRAVHHQAICWVEKCEHLIVWGSALHTYDAELASILMNAVSTQSKKNNPHLTIINPDAEARNRAAGLFHFETRPLTVLDRLSTSTLLNTKKVD
ncbi:MAG: hypothetical protein J0L93_08275 [Deltaproteobacteria bacterium]|nr:hypothetical protein [Deltaproteobacteria bacterium]